MTDTCDQSFIRVKYGDNQEAIFNPWCSSHTLMEWIRKKCNCDDDIIIDLVDLEGQVKNLSARTKEYASEVVNARETYVLIRVEKIGDGKYHYTSLLNNLGDVNPDLFGKLSVMSRPQTRTKGKAKNNKLQKPLKSSRNESPSKRPKSSEKKPK